jgi:hypothetical protein
MQHWDYALIRVGQVKWNVCIKERSLGATTKPPRTAQPYAMDVVRSPIRAASMTRGLAQTGRPSLHRRPAYGSYLRLAGRQLAADGSGRPGSIPIAEGKGREAERMG